MNLNTISPYVRRAMHSQLRAPFKIGQRIIFDYEIIYLAGGRFLFTCDGKEYICNKGDVVFIRPGHPHTLASIDNVGIVQPHIHFDLSYDESSDKVYISFKDLPNFSENERLMIRKDELDIGPILHISDKNAFTKLLYEIIGIFTRKHRLYQLECKEKMLQMLQMIIMDNTVDYDVEEPFVTLPAMIKHYIDYNFQNPITLDSLEKQFHYSKFHVSRVFFEETGETVIKYYNDKRIAYVKAMLCKGATVSEMVEKLNFSSIYSFSRWFKNAVGVPPSEYKSMK